MMYIPSYNQRNDVIQKSYFGMYRMLSYLGIFILTIGSLPIYVNLIKTAYNNKLLQVLSFFLLPLILVSLELILRFIRGDQQEIRVIYPTVLSFFFSLTIAYTYFVLIIKSKNIVEQANEK